ncbi:MAG: hypothetical protein LBU43_10870 [Candidatus Accumulibacter sp.]|jgi:Tfp pilus assembly protein PilF|nr:hypothetical protein [Accumulibacter sp.]
MTQIPSSQQNNPIAERGVDHFKRGETDAAFACLSQAVEQQSEDPRVYACLAFICAGQGLAREAENFISHAFRFAPGCHEYRAVLGESFLNAGNAAAAVRHLRLAVDAQPDLMAAYPALAEGYRRMLNEIWTKYTPAIVPDNYPRNP